MQIISKKPNALFVFFVLLFFSLDVQAPIVFYGTQFLGIFFLLLYRVLFYPIFSKKDIVASGLIFFILETLMIVQSFYIKDNDLMVLVYQRVIFLLIVSTMLIDYFKNIDINILRKTIGFFILFLSLIVVFQFLGFYVFGLSREMLDVGLLLGGEESRNWYTNDWSYRPTSLMSEPSIFVGVQFGLLALHYLLFKETSLVRVVGLLSLSLSLSFLGFILTALYLVVVYSRKLLDIIWLVVFGSIFYLFSYGLIGERIEMFLGGDDSSNNVKIEALNFILSDPMIILFGYGHLFQNENSPVFYSALGDLTFYINMLSIYGIIFGSFFIFIFFNLLFKSNTNFKEKVVICLALVKLSNPSVLFFSCFFMLLLTILRRREDAL